MLRRNRIHAFTFITLSTILALTVGLVAGHYHSLPEKAPDIEADADVGNYYSGISATATGNTLLGQIRDLTINKHTTYNTYGNLGSGGWQNDIDQSLDDSTKIIDFYTQAKMANTWKNPDTGEGAYIYNREHVWPKSLSNSIWANVNNDSKGPGADAHHIRPEFNEVNSARGNLPFGDAATTSASTFTYEGTAYPYGYVDSGTVFEPMDFVKGDVAREIFYVFIHYNTLGDLKNNTLDTSTAIPSTATPPVNYTGNLPLTNVIHAANKIAAFSLLVSWNASDPPNDQERHRNDRAAAKLGNRNPFIDHPEYIDKIWGSGLQSPIITMTNSLEIAVGETASLNAVLHNGGTAAISYSSSNTAVATVSAAGIVTGAGIGTAVITASATVNGTHVSNTCTVTVRDASVVYTKITKDAELSNGEYIIGAISGSNAILLNPEIAKGIDSNNVGANTKPLTGGTTVGSVPDSFIFILSGSGNSFSFKSKSSNKYLSPNADTSKDFTMEASAKSIYVTAGTSGTTIKKASNSAANLQYNASSPMFRSYSTAQKPVFLFKSGGGGTTPVAPTLTMPSALSLTVGSTGSAAATIHNGTGTITYSSNKTAVATVNSSTGLVTAVAVGSATITAAATVNGTSLTAHCTVTVSEAAAGTAGYKLVKKQDDLNAGEYLIAYTTKVLKSSDFTDTSGNYDTYTLKDETFGAECSKDSVQLIGTKPNFRIEVKKGNNGNYIYGKGTNASDNGLLFGSQTTAHVLAFTLNTTSFEVTISDSTAGTTLKFNTDSTTGDRWRFYKPTSGNVHSPKLYKKVEPPQYSLADFGSDFISTVTCDGGINPPSTSAWSTMRNKYNNLSAADKTTLKNAAYNNPTVGAAVERYDYIIRKYGTGTYDNFIGRSISSAHLVGMPVQNEGTAIIIFAVIVIATSGVVFFARNAWRRKEND